MTFNPTSLQFITNQDPYGLYNAQPNHPLAKPLAYLMMDRIPDTEAGIVSAFRERFPVENAKDKAPVTFPKTTSLEEFCNRSIEVAQKVEEKKHSKWHKRVLTVLSSSYFQRGIAFLGMCAAAASVFGWMSSTRSFFASRESLIAGTVVTSVVAYKVFKYLSSSLHSVYSERLKASVLKAYHQQPEQKNKPHVLGQLIVIKQWGRQVNAMRDQFQDLLDKALTSVKPDEVENVRSFIQGRIDHLNYQEEQFNNAANHHPDLKDLLPKKTA